MSTVAVPMKLITDRRLLPGAQIMWIWLASQPEPVVLSRREIAATSPFPDKTAARYIRQLEAAGWLTVTRSRERDGSHARNQYKVTVE